MGKQNLSTKNEIRNYEEYLQKFFPHPERIRTTRTTTPREIGVQMAKETLRHIQEALSNKTEN